MSVSLRIQGIGTQGPHLQNLISEKFFPQFAGLSFRVFHLAIGYVSLTECAASKMSQGKYHFEITERYQPRWKACLLRFLVVEISCRFHLQSQLSCLF